jgi:hypothetical protein
VNSWNYAIFLTQQGMGRKYRKRDRVGAQHLAFAILAALIGFHVVNVLLLGYQLAGS